LNSWGKLKKEFVFYLQFFHNFLNEISELISWMKYLHRVSKRWIQQRFCYLLKTFFIIWWMKFRYWVSKRWIQERFGYLLTIFHNLSNEMSIFCIQETNSRKSLLLTYSFFIIPWVKFLYCLFKRWIQETVGYLLTIFSLSLEQNFCIVYPRGEFKKEFVTYWQFVHNFLE
jgi:hypothetical protein